jgi:hypothetical protein
MGVIGIGMDTPWSTRENFACTLQHLVAPVANLGVLTTHLAAPGITGDKSGSTSYHSRAVWERKYFLRKHCQCSWKSQLLLIIQRFLTLILSIWILINVSRLLSIYTRYILTGCRWCLRAIAGAPQNNYPVNSVIHSTAITKRVWKQTSRSQLRLFGDPLGGCDQVNWEIHIEF